MYGWSLGQPGRYLFNTRFQKVVWSCTEDFGREILRTHFFKKEKKNVSMHDICYKIGITLVVICHIVFPLMSCLGLDDSSLWKWCNSTCPTTLSIRKKRQFVWRRPLGPYYCFLGCGLALEADIFLIGFGSVKGSLTASSPFCFFGLGRPLSRPPPTNLFGV